MQTKRFETAAGAHGFPTSPPTEAGHDHSAQSGRLPTFDADQFQSERASAGDDLLVPGHAFAAALHSLQASHTASKTNTHLHTHLCTDGSYCNRV